jgi:argininosuccinate lyase
MVRTLTPLPGNMREAAGRGFINATDYADYLVGKGLPFRTAYKLAGQTVALCMKEGFVLETLPLEKYRSLCPLADGDVYAAVDLDACVSRRVSDGGTSVASVEAQIAAARKKLAAFTAAVDL